jgi:hypothetical protein
VGQPEAGRALDGRSARPFGGLAGVGCNANELDEFALGGLARCTAVTVNAILQHFHKPAITLNDVPVDQPGVMRILVNRGGNAPVPSSGKRNATFVQVTSGRPMPSLAVAT